MTSCRTVKIEGTDMFYCEAGDSAAPTCSAARFPERLGPLPGR